MSFSFPGFCSCNVFNLRDNPEMVTVMRGDLIRILSSVEEKANELKLEGFEPDVVLVGKEAYEFIKEQVNEEFGGEEEVFELSSSG